MTNGSTDDGAVSLRVGVVLYENEARELERLAASLSACARDDATPRLSVAFHDNSPTSSLQATVERLAVGSYVHSERNLGFGAAHNLLMRDAFRDPAVRHYLCLNPDALLHPECLGALVRQATTHERIGLVEALQFPDEHPKKYDPETFETGWCSGCVLLVTRQLFEAIGGFDEQLFMYCEDVDLSWRARAEGFATLVAPNALAHHHVGHRQPSRRVVAQTLRSGIYLGQKYGNAAFAASCGRELEKQGLDHAPVAKMPSAPAKLRRVADFGHLFHFSEVRW